LTEWGSSIRLEAELDLPTGFTANAPQAFSVFCQTEETPPRQTAFTFAFQTTSAVFPLDFPSQSHHIQSVSTRWAVTQPAHYTLPSAIVSPGAEATVGDQVGRFMRDGLFQVSPVLFPKEKHASIGVDPIKLERNQTMAKRKKKTKRRRVASRSLADLFTPARSTERPKPIYIRPDTQETHDRFTEMAKRAGYRSGNEFGLALVKWALRQGDDFLKTEGR